MNTQYKTIIVDDEPPARQRLIELLAAFPETFSIVDQASNGTEAIAKIREHNPDLIFLDIQMAGMTGFEMLTQLEKIPMIIFCTAFDQYSLKAFETNSVDYLLKPVKLERLEQTVAKLNLFKMNFSPEKILEFLKGMSAETNRKPMTSITIRKGSKLILIKLEDIAYFEASDKYVSAYTAKGEENITDQTLAVLEETLPDYFLRVHRSIIINTRLVKELESYFNSRYSITLSDLKQSKIVSGRSYQSQIKEWMGLR